MKLTSVLALIQLFALLQIGWAVIAPGIWDGRKSDLETSLRIGGDQAVERWRRSEEIEARSVRTWGIGLGGAVFLLATTATIINGRRKVQENAE